MAYGVSGALLVLGGVWANMLPVGYALKVPTDQRESTVPLGVNGSSGGGGGGGWDLFEVTYGISQGLEPRTANFIPFASATGCALSHCVLTVILRYKPKYCVFLFFFSCCWSTIGFFMITLHSSFVYLLVMSLIIGIGVNGVIVTCEGVIGFVVDEEDFAEASTITDLSIGLGLLVSGLVAAVVDLPDPVPFRFIPDTNLTVEFFINAAGGVWIQERTIDSLAFGCTEFLPDLESMIPDFRTFSAFYEPVCREVLVAANDLAVFDAESSCTDLTAVFTDLISTDDGYRKRRQADMAEEDMFDFIGILSNTTKDLYGLNISDQSTVCPNIKQFLEPSLPEVATRFLTELTSAVLPQAAPYFCEDWEQFLSSVGISKTSPHYPIIYDLADIGSQMLGHDSRDAICEAIQQALSYGRADRKALGRDALESFLDIFTDVERCMMIGNDAIDDIIEPLFGIDVPGFEVTSYLISRYTGYNGVKDICNALETAFTVLSGSTLTLTITGETLNGEELMYTTDLTNMASPAFKKLETIYCGVATNHLERELGSDLRRLDCVANSFNPGSIVAELEIQVFATTQDVADSLAEDVAELSTGEGLVLSSDGDSMSVSSFSATPNSGRLVHL
eukprot:XP_011664354.1 PREDICTED: uncharacterized protein LOC105438340 [Strongylocentrotus purpuratus]